MKHVFLAFFMLFSINSAFSMERIKSFSGDSSEEAKVTFERLLQNNFSTVKAIRFKPNETQSKQHLKSNLQKPAYFKSNLK